MYFYRTSLCAVTSIIIKNSFIFLQDRLYCTVGCHPTRCLEFDEKSTTPTQYLEKLRKIIENGKSKVIAVGECGLDYERTQFCPIDIQKKLSINIYRISPSSKFLLKKVNLFKCIFQCCIKFSEIYVSL